MDRVDDHRCRGSHDRSSADPGVPRFEGQGREALDLRQGASSHASWPGDPRLEGQVRRARHCYSEQPRVSRVRHTEVERNEQLDGERQQRTVIHGRRVIERSLCTPVFAREQAVNADYLEQDDTRGRAETNNNCTRADEVSNSRLRTRRKRNMSSSSESGEPQPSVSRRRKKNSSNTDAILDKFLSILQSVKSSDKSKLTFNTNIIPEFDPMSKEQTILTWLTKVEECSEIYGWEDKEIIHYALPKLTGVAKSWYQSLPTMKYTWIEWKNKLIESFPIREDYAELLTEMLAKRVKYGESLEQYYYAKMNLLNRCKIYGRQAVDCLLYGIEDRAVKVGAQAAQFLEPEKVLKYLRTVKVGQSRENHESYFKLRNERRSTISAVRSGGLKFDTKMICYNCDEPGHPSFKCSKPPAKCSICEKSGHLSIHCFKNKTNRDREKDKNPNKDKPEKQVSQLSQTEDHTAKYIITIKINNNPIDCHLDLGSQCSLIRLSKAKELKLEIVVSDDLPVLRAIGANLVAPVGMTIVSVEVQGIKKTVNMYIVDDYVITQSVLLGHSFTENPDIIITKTPTEIIFQKIQNIKTSLVASKDTEIPANTLRVVQIIAEPNMCGQVFVNGSVRGPEGKEHYLLPGDYEVRNGHGALLIYNVSANIIAIKKGTLLSRVVPKSSESYKHILNSCNITFYETQKSDNLNCNDNLSTDERTMLQELVEKYRNCFSTGLHDLGFTDLTEMVIELEDTEPVVYRPYRMSYADRSLVRNMVQEMVDHGIVRESTSPYASPILLVQKKTGDKRLCIDYRALNRKTKKEHYPLPRIEDQLDQLTGNKIFTSLDLASGYYQISIAEESRHKTAFVTPDGQYEYNRMPFGLVNAPSVFQRTINKILLEAKIKYALVYMDDILIPSKDVTEGLKRLEEVLELLKRGGLTLKLSKCHFFLETIDFLGYEVNSDGIRPGTRKTEAVAKFPKPSNQHEVRQFLGLSGYFRRFIKDYALLAAPLTDLLKKDAKWSWTDNQDCAFNKIKELLVNRPILTLYNPNADTQVHTDACKEGLAGILLQANCNGVFQPVSYFSRKTNTEERKFHSYDLETLAVVASLNRFKVYLIGIKFKIFTDCNALRATLVKRDLIPRIARWWIQLQEFDCTIEYRPGSRMSHVDALSRNPVGDGEMETPTYLDVMTLENGEEDWIVTVQSADEEVKKIREILSSPNTEQIMDIHKNYKLKNNRVYRIIGEDIRWLVPKGVRWQILKMNHDDVGHCGFDKTLLRIRKNYWFAKMRKFVKKYVSSCLECLHHKAPGGRREGELHPIDKPSVPFHTIHADHLGPFVKSKKGNCYLLVIVDGFTKFVNIRPVRDTKSSTTIKILKDHVSNFGVSSRLITDKGTSFTSGIFKEFTKFCGIKHVVNAVATPRANGQVERFNRTILNALSTLNHGKDERTWDDNILDIQLGLNTTTHKTTQKTPSELLFGFNIKCRSEGILSAVLNDTVNVSSEEELVCSREEAREKIIEKQTKDQEKYNSHRKAPKQYSEGDLVRVERQVPHDGQSQKLVVKYQGPYRIIKTLPNDRYVIEDTPLSRKNNRRYEAIVAVDKIQPWLNFSRDLESSCEENDSDEE
ncbi:jg21182 [Pararge aegeria aegeria]|uniref:RNA-directed DNA polymerase n=1 Tax=Pararge aegeria aegeria TaxID=348720 RepID=A0A8S4R5T4_9NEOP|nr:jg21182 [Pararge aegeria aegeria]